jgi:hypothetical protein
MSLKELDGFKIPFEIGGEKKYLKYNLNSRLYLEYMTDFSKLEHTAPSDWSFDDILHYLRAMLLDSYFEQNKEFIEARDFASCLPKLTDLGRLLDEIGIEQLVNKILNAIVESLPMASINEDKTGNPQVAV